MLRREAGEAAEGPEQYAGAGGRGGISDAPQKDHLDARDDQHQLGSDCLPALTAHQHQAAPGEDGREPGGDRPGPMPVHRLCRDLLEVKGHRYEHQTDQGRAPPPTMKK